MYMCCTCNTAAVLRRAGVITPQAARGATPVAAIRRYYSAHSEFRFSCLDILCNYVRFMFMYLYSLWCMAGKQEVEK